MSKAFLKRVPDFSSKGIHWIYKENHYIKHPLWLSTNEEEFKIELNEWKENQLTYPGIPLMLIERALNKRKEF